MLYSPTVPSVSYGSGQRWLNALFLAYEVTSLCLLPCSVSKVPAFLLYGRCSQTFDRGFPSAQETCTISSRILSLDSSVLFCLYNKENNVLPVHFMPKLSNLCLWPFFFSHILAEPFCQCHRTSSDIYQLSF